MESIENLEKKLDILLSEISKEICPSKISPALNLLDKISTKYT